MTRRLLRGLLMAVLGASLLTLAPVVEPVAAQAQVVPTSWSQTTLGSITVMPST